MCSFLCEFQALLLNQFMTLNDIHIIGPTFFYGTYKDVVHKVVEGNHEFSFVAAVVGFEFGS